MAVFLVAANGKADSEKDVDTAEPVKQNDETSPELLPRAIHKTQSIFLRNLPTLITRQEIEEVRVIIYC